MSSFLKETPTITHTEVSDYYSKILSKTSDLKTNACCTSANPPLFLRNALSKIHDSVLSKYYGCGLILPELLEGDTVVLQLEKN
jgi:arsenite methyltransferase